MHTGNLLFKTFLLLAVLVIVSVYTGFAQQNNIAGEVLPIWAEGAPDAKGSADSDQPTLTVFLPEEELSVGTGVVVFPGGGYSHLAMEHEGYDVAGWLNEMGIAAFVVKYRLGDKYRHPTQLRDAQQAVQLVRVNAKEWNIEPDKVGVLGFSAGGHLATTVGTHFEAEKSNSASPADQFNSRPDFMILIYPVITMQADFTHQGSRYHLLEGKPDEELVKLLSNEQQVSDRTPPTFLVHTSNDSAVPVQNSVQFYQSLIEHGVPAEMHLFEDGPHGFGLAPDNPQLSKWTELCEQWLRSRGFL